jgi:hypothetical protein
MRKTLYVWIFVCLGYLPLIGQSLLFQSDAYSIYDNSVKEGKYEAAALDNYMIRSNYKGLNVQGLMRPITFKFSINGLDNEAASGADHHVSFDPKNGKYVTPLFTFSKPELDEKQQPNPDNEYLQKKSSFDVVFRLDMREVLKAFNEQGYYKTYDGGTIRKEDFTGVYIGGDAQPLTWDFASLPAQNEFKLEDPDKDGIYEVSIHFTNRPYREVDNAGNVFWKLEKDITPYPEFKSEKPLLNALYNMSLEEMVTNLREDGAFNTGANWPGVWTRDVSYSIILSLAAIHPEASKKCLMAKVKDGKLIQDTGTGGSWPVSTDRMIWTVAAWEIYCATGDTAWLKQVYPLIKNSAEADIKTILDPETKLIHGESSFLDWREQTYPRWMDAKDIYKSTCLGTNALHYQTYKILADMSASLGEDGSKYDKIAEDIKTAMNNYLWMEEKGYYTQYLYGRTYFSLSPKSEALGEALSALYGIAEGSRAASVISNTPVAEYGVPTIYPYIPDIPPYHNNSVWPFVEAYWTWASKEAENEISVERGLAAMFRASALFLTNKENLVASTGDYEGTEINSSRQLWSIAGNLAMVYRIFFGMKFDEDGLAFSPFIPKAYEGTYTLNNFKYRGAVLNITVKGSGSKISSMLLDGQKISSNKIAGNLKGRHTIEIELNKENKGGKINLVKNVFSPETPNVSISNDKLIWSAVDNTMYEIYKNGELLLPTEKTEYGIENSSGYAEYQVKAIQKNGTESFLSEPIAYGKYKPITVKPANVQLKQKHASYSGEGYAELENSTGAKMEFEIDIPKGGDYAIDFRYANGNGSLTGENMCAVRTLVIDGEANSVIVLPQRGENVWDNWGYTNSVMVELTKGNHTITLEFKKYNENMNGEVNFALIDYLRAVKPED